MNKGPVSILPIGSDEETARLIMRWENEIRSDPRFRENSFDNQLLVWSEHLDWFQKLNVDDCFFVQAENEKVGFLNCKTNHDQLKIGVLISIPFQGNGFGSKALRLYAIFLSEKYPACRVVAEILPHNKASVAAFLNADFQVISESNDLIVMEYFGLDNRRNKARS